ncbi:UNVERIFIED_CONTAM: hypothetical protein Sindi_2887200 [Sesamum indicum]
MGKGKTKRLDSHGFQNMFVLIAMKIRRRSVLKPYIIKVVNKSRRLRQMVLKLSNGKDVATEVKELD